MVQKQDVLRPCAVALAVALALGLSGCGGGGGANVRPSAPPPTNTTPPATNPPPADTTPNPPPADTTPPVTNPPPTDTTPPPVAEDVNVTVDGSSTTIWSNDHSGAGGLIKGGTGALVLLGTNTYTGGTTISDGTLQLGGGGMVGSIVGDVTDNGELIFHHGDDVTFDGIVSGSGSLVQYGGTLVLTGNNTYTGGTEIWLGTLQIGDGGTVGAITGMWIRAVGVRWCSTVVTT